MRAKKQPAARVSKKRVEQLKEVLAILDAEQGSPRFIPRFTAMEELVSCILTQHTSDANSFPAFTNLLESFPTWHDVVEAGAERVAGVIRSAGLANQKSKSIVNSLREIHGRTGSYSLEVLRDMDTGQAQDWLQSLPGVGPKTASIVLCFAMGRDAIPVDTHVYRVSWRLGLVREGVGELKAFEELTRMMPTGLSYRFHLALIQHGRMVCKAKTPLCDLCSIRDLCDFGKRQVKGSISKTI